MAKISTVDLVVVVVVDMDVDVDRDGDLDVAARTLTQLQQSDAARGRLVGHVAVAVKVHV